MTKIRNGMTSPGGGTVKSCRDGGGTKTARIVDEMMTTVKFVSNAIGEVYRYSEMGGAYSKLPSAVLNSLAYKACPGANSTMRREIVERLKVSCYEEDLTWGRVADFEIPCANGILNVKTGELREHSPIHYLERSLPVAYDPAAKCPIWEKTLSDWFPPDRDGGRRAALQEFLGYICLAHAKYKRAAVLYGESNTGKSVAVMVAKALVGDRFTCQLAVEDMGDPRRRAVLKGMALNVLSELSADAMIADGGFKQLVSTEEPVMLDEKYVCAESYTPTCKHIIATNNLPAVTDRTSATFKRLLVIPFDEVVPEALQNRELLDQLKGQELPGILVWASEGARRLVVRRGRWADVPAAASILRAFEDEMNPMKMFMRERMVIEKDKLTPLHEITRQFNAWHMAASKYGVKGIGRMLRGAGYGGSIVIGRVGGRGGITCLLGFSIVDEVRGDLRAGSTMGSRDPSTGLEEIEASPMVAPDRRRRGTDRDPSDDTHHI